MISAETRVQIRHPFFAEHWKIGTIASEVGIHPDAVRHAIESDRFNRAQALRSCLTDPNLPFIHKTLEQYSQLRAIRIYQVVRDRGYLCEIKRATDVETSTVQKKAKAAIQWCERATVVSDRPQQYTLIPHDVIEISRTFASLVGA